MFYNDDSFLPVINDIYGQYVGMPGDRLRVRHWWGDHVGTLNNDGAVWAASKKFNGVRKVTLEAFSGQEKIYNEGHLGPRTRTEVLNAYTKLESDGYCVLSKNCEHIDNFTRGLGYKSPQIASLLLAGFGALFLIAAAKR